ncbi:hypothetical protein SAMN05428977_10013 [Nitrosomonas sp. Nm166]|nr:hypothetical protein SAMN05428977_10013 [Nitrosomonas sp. Nm166]
MDKAHSINKSYFRRILGTKHSKSDNSMLEVEVGEFRDIDIGCILLTLQKSNGPALRLTLLGQEAQDLGLALLTLGAKLSALQEEDSLRSFPDREVGKPSTSDGTFIFDCREIKDAS